MNTALTVLVIAALGMAAGAFYLWRRGAPRKQVVLMALVALVMFANVLIWTLPYASGEAPVDKAEALAK